MPIRDLEPKFLEQRKEGFWDHVVCAILLGVTKLSSVICLVITVEFNAFGVWGQVVTWKEFQQHAFGQGLSKMGYFRRRIRTQATRY
jgi:hypothetical protein